jgi:hypothetical protein
VKKIATVDLETDPFEYGQMVNPFVAGFYDGERYVTFWGTDCVSRLVKFLEAEDTEYTLYVHNGGRFDFFYFMPYIRHSLRIVNGRIIHATLGKHEFRDSYAIMPFPLADYDKDAIDYEKMAEGVREQHRDEILKYLRKDCVALYELVTAFFAEFGDKLTIGSASMKQIQARHKFKKGSAKYDSQWRERFYFGGRNQVFQAGVTRGNIRVYDVNSMYPYAMRAFLHPIGISGEVSKRILSNSVFIVVEGKNYGAFPVREKDGSLNFTKEYGIFNTTIHEWNAAEDTGAFKCYKVHKAYGWKEQATFDDFVTHFYDARAIAKASDDAIRAIFYKYVLNSGYGKFAQNPENYSDYYVAEIGNLPAEWHECDKACEQPCKKLWSIDYRHEQYIIWKRPLQIARSSWYNIATGASITGAARSILLRGLRATRYPIYCDTDSIICRGDCNVEIHSTDLGKWDLEANGTVAYVGGKKLYAIFKPENTLTDKERTKIFPPTLTENQLRKTRQEKVVGNMVCVKKAHKGARLNARQIIDIVNGEKITSLNPVPNFKWDGSYTFTKREIKRTA